MTRMSKRSCMKSNTMFAVRPCSILHEPLCIEGQRSSKKLLNEVLAEHAQVMLTVHNFFKEKGSDKSMTGYCGPHCNPRTMMLFMKHLWIFSSPKAYILFVNHTTVQMKMCLIRNPNIVTSLLLILRPASKQ